MAFVQILAGEVDANSPITDTLGEKIRNNFDALDQRTLGTSPEQNKIPFDDAIVFPRVRGTTIVSTTHNLGADDIVLVNTSGGNVTVNFPSAGTIGKDVYGRE